MHARKLMDNGCLSYLALVHVYPQESPSLENTRFMSEFMDIFPTDLLGVPPSWDIDFSIDMEPGTKSISIAPYQMAPVELRELKE